MPHVDEGTLHALLDGALRAMEPGEADVVEAHLEACAECRARLDEAAALRGRAGEVLAVLEPAVAPDFEEVLVRAGAADRGRRLARQARWTRGVAWAATIVVALGTGYLIRDRLVPERAAQARSVELSAPERAVGSEADGAAAVDMGGGESAEAADQGRLGNPEVEGEEATQRTERAGGARAPAGVMRSVTPPRDRPATPMTAPMAPTQDRAAGGDRAVPVQPAAGEADPGAEPRLEAVAGTLTTPGVALEDLRVTGLRSEDAPQEDAAVADGMAVDASVAAERSITPEEAAALLGTPLLILPRAELVRAEAAVAADVPTVVSLQRLGEGTLVRVTQRPLAAEAPLGRAVPERTRDSAQPRLDAAMPLAETDAAAAVTTVRVDVSGSELVVEGPLPAAALEVLAASATPYVAPR